MAVVAIPVVLVLLFSSLVVVQCGHNPHKKFTVADD